MKSNKTLGILLLLIYVCVCTAMLNDAFIQPYNLQNILRSSCLFAIIGIGAVMVIVTGGIDLSTGSLIGLVGCTMVTLLKSLGERDPNQNLNWFLKLAALEALLAGIVLLGWTWLAKGSLRSGWKWPAVLGGMATLTFLLNELSRSVTLGAWVSVAVAVMFALYLSLHLGLLHGLLITQLKLQPFVVTLCGLMCYRGLNRWLTNDQTQGLGTAYNDSLRLLAVGKPCTMTFVMLCGGVVLAALGLWRTVWARGDNRTASRGLGISMFVCGAILALVCSSRYWDGWKVKPWGEPLFTIAQGTEFQFFTLSIPEEAVKRPAVLMGYSIYPLLASVVGLVLLQGKRRFEQGFSRKVVGELICVVGLAIGLVGLFWMKTWIGDQAVSFSTFEETRNWGISTTVWKATGVFAGMALVIGCLMNISKTWVPNFGTLGKMVWYFGAFCAALWLVSKTAVPETTVQTPFFIMLAIGLIAAVFLNKTVSGRYLLAMGNNEEAARYSGIDTDRMKILAYVLCAVCGGIGAVLFTLDSNSVEPSGFGSFYELYAIAAAVLGGCSLRGGEGSVLGVIIGASIMRILYNAPDMIGIPSQLELFTIGIVILIGVIVDESAKRIAAHRDRTIRS